MQVYFWQANAKYFFENCLKAEEGGVVERREEGAERGREKTFTKIE